MMEDSGFLCYMAVLIGESEKPTASIFQFQAVTIYNKINHFIITYSVLRQVHSPFQSDFST